MMAKIPVENQPISHSAQYMNKAIETTCFLDPFFVDLKKNRGEKAIRLSLF